MGWVDVVGRDPVPWLLDPGNPSARYLTLKHIFRKSEAALEADQARILAWRPVQMLRQHWTPASYWGRATTPYYGGAAGNFGILYLLAQLGAPQFPEVAPTCESLLEYGRLSDGAFAPSRQAAAPWLCYTGMALRILSHFNYVDDPRTQQGWRTLTRVIHDNPEDLDCAAADRDCNAAAVKVLGAYLHRAGDRPLEGDQETIDILCRYLLRQDYDWAGREADWLMPRFPRYYDTDVVELGHLLAHTSHREAPLCQDIIARMLTCRNGEGRWIKTKTTPVFPEERIMQPSRWLTFEAVHAVMLIHGDKMYAT